MEGWATGRHDNAVRYASEFSRLGLDGQLELPAVAAECESVWNQFTVRVRAGRDAFQQHLTRLRVGSAIYYPIPLHLQECYADLGYTTGTLPVTEQAAEEVLSLPVFAELEIQEQDRVIQAAAEFCGIEYSMETRTVRRSDQLNLRCSGTLEILLAATGTQRDQGTENQTQENNRPSHGRFFQLESIRPPRRSGR